MVVPAQLAVFQPATDFDSCGACCSNHDSGYLASCGAAFNHLPLPFPAVRSASARGMSFANGPCCRAITFIGVLLSCGRAGFADRRS